MAKEVVKRGPGRPKKLSKSNIISIKRTLKEGAPLMQIAKEFKCSVSTVKRALPNYAQFLRAA